MKWFSKAAEQGHDGAQHCLGICYYNGQGISQNREEAMKWLRKAAEQGQPIATKFIQQLQTQNQQQLSLTERVRRLPLIVRLFILFPILFFGSIFVIAVVLAVLGWQPPSGGSSPASNNGYQPSYKTMLNLFQLHVLGSVPYC